MGLALMRSEEVTIAEILRKNGYKTAIFGKWHLGDNFPLRPMDQGFEHSLIFKGPTFGSIPDAVDNSLFDPILFLNGQPGRYHGYCTDIFF